jgi:trehalose 6-phosphate phosphatase
MDVYEPRTAAGAEGLAELRRRPRGAVLGFDFDGTLSPIVDDPDQARAVTGAAEILTELAASAGAVVIITGRPAEVAVANGGFGGIDGLVVLGGYGRERWENGVLEVPDPPPGVAEARAKLPRLLVAAGAPEGVTIEDKGHALAVHTRRAAEPEIALQRLRGLVEALAERTGLALEPGKFVLELRPPGMDKGVALASFAAERSATSVLFAGDDLGDLAAFDAVDRLRAGGVPGVTVCSASAETTTLAERADIVVDGPAGVVDFLGTLL